MSLYMKPALFLLLLLPACTVAPIKQAVGEAVHKRIEARNDDSVQDEPSAHGATSLQVCSCQTQYESPAHGPAKLDCSIAEIPNN